MTIGIAGKVALVTGGAGGIGRATALRLARAGADVAIADIDLNISQRWGEQLSAPTVKDEILALGRRAAAFEGDLSRREASAEMISSVIASLGRIDLFVHAAGGINTPVETSFASNATDADMTKLFDANYRTVINGCQAVVPHMKERGSGAIVNVTSGAGGNAGHTGALAHYGAAKAAVTMFTRTLAGELGQHGIRVNAVSPGFTESARAKTMDTKRGIGTGDLVSKIAMRRFGTPEDVAKVIEFLVSDLAGFVTGQSIAVNGGATLGPC